MTLLQIVNTFLTPLEMLFEYSGSITYANIEKDKNTSYINVFFHVHVKLPACTYKRSGMLMSVS